MPRRRLYILGAACPGHTPQRPPGELRARLPPAASPRRTRFPRRPAARGRRSCRPGRGGSGATWQKEVPAPAGVPLFSWRLLSLPGFTPASRLAHSAGVDAPQAPRAREHEITSDVCRDRKEGNKNIPLTAQSSVRLKVWGSGERWESAGRGGEWGGGRWRGLRARRSFVMVPERDPRSSCSLAIT